MHGGGLELALVFLLAAVVAVPVFKRFGLGAVLGYLVAGALLGPHALKLVRDPEPVLAASEIGVVMLLFVIGLELSLPRLKVMKRPVFGVGGLQVALSGAALGLLAHAGGLGWAAALVVGVGLALSSTAVGLQLLSERAANSTATTAGSASPSCCSRTWPRSRCWRRSRCSRMHCRNRTPRRGWRWASRRRDRRAGARRPPAAAPAVPRHRAHRHARGVHRGGAAGGAGQRVADAAAGLSAGLGAFLAGVLLAESEYRHELESQIQPFEGLLLGLFFMAVGMSPDLQRVAAEPALIALGVAVLMAVKFALLFALGLRPGRLDWRGALALGAVLALGGEFAFVVFSEAEVEPGRRGHARPPQRHRRPVDGGDAAAADGDRAPGFAGQGAGRRAFDEIPDDAPQVLIAGFGRFGQIVARLLFAQHIRFVAIDPDVEQVDFFRRFGNRSTTATRPSPTCCAPPAQGADRGVRGRDDLEASLRITRLLRRQYPKAKVFVRARDRRHAWQLMDFWG